MYILCRSHIRTYIYWDVYHRSMQMVCCLLYVLAGRPPACWSTNAPLSSCEEVACVVCLCRGQLERPTAYGAQSICRRKKINNCFHSHGHVWSVVMAIECLYTLLLCRCNRTKVPSLPSSLSSPLSLCSLIRCVNIVCSFIHGSLRKVQYHLRDKEHCCQVSFHSE